MIDFLAQLAADMPDDERLILCGFEGDPNVAPYNAWRPRPWRPGREIPFEKRANGYVTVASFHRLEDNTFRRRTEAFAAGRALMVDDVGTKVPIDIVKPLNPTAIIETSPNNFQYWYLLEEPERDRERFDGVIKAFIAGRLLGADPGMAGINRVGRLPGYTNGKVQHNGWIVKLHELNEHRFTIVQLLSAFDLRMPPRDPPPRNVPFDISIIRARDFDRVLAFLRHYAMIKRQEDPSGWIEIHCPWVGNHTGEADTGAAIRVPSRENGYYGSFRCHHGHCEDKAWRDLTEWVGDHANEFLEEINAAAPATLKELGNE